MRLWSGSNHRNNRKWPCGLLPCVYEVFPVSIRCVPGVYPRLIPESPVFTGVFVLFLHLSLDHTHALVRTLCKPRIDAESALTTASATDDSAPSLPQRRRQLVGTRPPDPA